MTQANPALRDFTPEKLIAMADAHDDMAFAEFLKNHKSLRRSGDFYELLSGLSHPYGNMLFGLEVPDAAATVADVTARLTHLNVPAMWWVGACTKPGDLGELLVAQGWKPSGPTPVMVADIEGLAEPRVPEGFELRRVVTPADHAVWKRIVSEGFGLPMEVAELMFGSLENAGRLYTAHLNGQPAGTTAMFPYDGVAGIYCVATLPDFRGKGVGGAMTALPLLEARAEGYRVGTLQASKMGYPIYKKLGFQDVCELRVYSFGGQ